MRILPRVLLLCLVAVSARGADTTASGLPAADLVVKALANESGRKHSSEHVAFLAHERSTRTGGHMWVEKVVRAQDGDLRRLLSIDGQPLSAARARAEDQRLAQVAAHPDELRRASQSAQKREELLRAVPRMYLFAYAGQDGNCTRILYSPNPAFTPGTYEERVMHALKGSIRIQQPEDRICGVDAEITQPVEFGYGFLGRVKPGGTVRMAATETAWKQWVTSEVHIHVNGKLMFLRNLSEDQDETRTDFVRLPPDLTLADAVKASRP